MRIEACTLLGNQIRMVWHCEECRRVMCEWVDLDLALYCEWVSIGSKRIKQARSIVFDRQCMVIFINPVDDGTTQTADCDSATAVL